MHAAAHSVSPPETTRAQPVHTSPEAGICAVYWMSQHGNDGKLGTKDAAQGRRAAGAEKYVEETAAAAAAAAEEAAEAEAEEHA